METKGRSDTDSDDDEKHFSTSYILEELGFRKAVVEQVKSKTNCQKMCRNLLINLIYNLPIPITSQEEPEMITIEAAFQEEIIAVTDKQRENTEDPPITTTEGSLQQKNTAVPDTHTENTMDPPIITTKAALQQDHITVTDTQSESTEDPPIITTEEALQEENVAVTDMQTENTETVATKRKRLGEKEWLRNVTKRNRMTGQPYKGFKREGNKVSHDSFKSGRIMGPTCTSQTCARVNTRKCNIITEDERKKIFDEYWSMDWHSKKVYVKSMIDSRPPQRPKTVPSHTSKIKYFHLKSSTGERIPVCMRMFLSTLAIKEWTVRYWISYGPSENTERGENNENTERREKVRLQDDINKYLDSLPKMPSHYCRQSTHKLYLESAIQNMSQLYNLYTEKMKEETKQWASRRTFDKVFKDKNLSIFSPRKDQCDICCQHKVGNLTEEQYSAHVKDKDRAQGEKKTDKEEAKKGKCHVFTVDLQAVKVAPSLLASSMYYKTKLSVHNYTVYNLSDHTVRCYWFSEIDADLSASTFASFLVDIIREVVQKNPLPLIIYSDGCTYQNRNAVVSNALLHLANEITLPIQQKYLVKGHTQMEADSVHSVIERKLQKKEIYLPSDYSRITKTARSSPFPYESKMVDFSFFKNYTVSMVYDSIKPSRVSVAGGNVVTDIRALLYEPAGRIKYKTDFDMEYEELPRRPKNIAFLTEFPRSYTEPLKIKKTKFDHLQQLKELIPADCRTFYENLPHV